MPSATLSDALPPALRYIIPGVVLRPSSGEGIPHWWQDFSLELLPGWPQLLATCCLAALYRDWSVLALAVALWGVLVAEVRNPFDFRMPHETRNGTAHSTSARGLNHCWVLPLQALRPVNNPNEPQITPIWDRRNRSEMYSIPATIALATGLLAWYLGRSLPEICAVYAATVCIACAGDGRTLRADGEWRGDRDPDHGSDPLWQDIHKDDDSLHRRATKLGLARKCLQ